MARGWPRIERQREFDAIRSALRANGAGCGVLLSGDAGVGKTTLARSVTETVDGRVRWVAGTESARTIPLGAFAQMIGAGTLRDPVTVLSAVRDALLADGPLLLGVDDAHLLDQFSATLLHQLAIDRAVRIVATVRSGESVPDAVVSLWKDGHLTRLALSPFTKEQSIELVETALGGHLEGFSADLMWDASAGNALFLRHLVESALDAGRLRQVRGVWQLRGQATITNELAALLEGRIERLPDAIVDAVALLSLCEPIDVDMLGELAGAQAVEQAETRGLIQVSGDGEQLVARFTHPLFGEVIRRRLGVAAARRLRGRLVTAMRARGRGHESDRIRLAELALDSDQHVDAALLVDAAHAAVALSDVALGERLARAAATRCGGGFESADLLARALLWQGRASEVEEVMAGFDPDTLDERSLLRWGSTRISNLYFSVGDAEEGNRILALLKSRITDPVLALVVAGLECSSAYHQNRLDEAVAIGERVLSASDAPPWAIAWASLGVGRSLGVMGRGNDIDEIARRLRLVRSSVDGLLAYPAGFGEIQALTFVARFADAEKKAMEYRGFSTTGQYLAWGMAATMIGWVAVGQGRFGHVVDTLEASVAALLSESAAAWTYPARIALGKAYAGLGRAGEARAVIADARQRLGRHNAVFDPPLRVAEAWLAAAEGTPVRAIEAAHDAARAAAQSGQFAVEAEALHAAARYGDRTVAPRLGEFATQLDGPLPPLYARHAAGVAAADGVVLDACADEFDRLGTLLSAADAAAQAATAHDHHGDRTRTAAAAFANRLAAMCGGADTPAIRVAAQPLPLTAREREIARLVAAGLSNREIAARLHLSVRTVEGHLYRACTKLDVTDREQLAALLLRQRADRGGDRDK